MTHKTDTALIDEVMGNPASSNIEIALAERLYGAHCELQRLVGDIGRLRAKYGDDT